jgi:hypothetical protein
VTIESKIISLVEKAETVPLQFTLELECLRDQGSLKGRLMDEQTYMKSYMAFNG